MTVPIPEKRWLVACDESGMDGAPYYGFGSLWLSWDRRGDLSKGFSELRARHRYRDECKWKAAGTKQYAGFFEELIDYFFDRRWLAFHCLVVRKSVVRRAAHRGSLQLGQRKHLTMLLTDKMKRALNKSPGSRHHFHVWVDTLPFSYKKSHEVIEVISNNVLQREVGGRRAVHSVQQKNSKETDAIQLCDLLLGAVLAAWQGRATSEAKHRVMGQIAARIGWPDLRADTRPHERRFNIWHFHPEGDRPREVLTRRVDIR